MDISSTFVDQFHVENITVSMCHDKIMFSNSGRFVMPQEVAKQRGVVGTPEQTTFNHEWMVHFYDLTASDEDLIHSIFMPEIVNAKATVCTLS